MKFTRPAIAVVAVAVVAAGTVPAVQHSATSDDGPGVFQAVNKESQGTVAAESTTASPTPGQLTTVSSTTEKTTPSSTPTDTTTKSTPPSSQVTVTTTKVVTAGTSEIPLDRKPTDNDNPLVDGTRQPGTSTLPVAEPEPNADVARVTPLTQAPKTYKGQDQRWVELLERSVNLGPRGNLYMKSEALQVYSPSMGRQIPIAVLHATDPQGNDVSKDAPTVYLLNGAGGSEQNTDWISQAYSVVVDTYYGQGVNVVIPMEGAFSYYVDWADKPPVKNAFYKGEQKWSTFLAQELPPAVEGYLGANDKRAIAGLSMAATSVLLLAEHNPGLYDAVGSFSGCAATSTPIPNFFVGLTVDRGAPGKMTPEHIFGPMGSDYNRYYDALVNAEKLKGTKVYLSTGTGLAGETDMPGYLKTKLEKAGVQSADAFLRGSANAMTLQVEGGAIEAAMNSCTHDLIVKMKANGMKQASGKTLQDGDDFVTELRNVGTHSWPVWKDDLKLSYERVFKKALGL